MSYLIYAAYGSNMLRERFLYYIKGGFFEDKYYEGSRDKTEPEDLGWMFVPYRLYFAKSSSRWDCKGVAFLSCRKESNPNHHAIVRLWKVSKFQFEDIQRQEGSSWYNVVLPLGEKEGYQIKSITGCWEDEKQRPSVRYLEIIKRGIKETTNWDDGKIEEYLVKFL
ncbi:MAG: hypothetical protein N2511_07740 [Thermodesulfovibrionales bacterium]|nr:hypothetical protein [Thermodesulfovibrionales bacterium]